MKIILAGTPEFAVATFKKVINHFEVVAIITQPDQINKRHRQTVFSPVKQLALKHQIQLLQPSKIATSYETLKKLDFEIFLTCAFGQIIPENILALAQVAALNIHGSLLPKYRGAAPVQHAILNGETMTGLSLIYMIKKMDAGAILFTEEINLKPHDNAGTVLFQLANLAATKIVGWLEAIIQKQFQARAQSAVEVTFAPKILKTAGQISSADTVAIAQRKILAYTPSPGAYIIVHDIKYKLLAFSAAQGLKLKLRDGVLYVTKLQKAGKKGLDYQTFLRGNKLDLTNFR